MRVVIGYDGSDCSNVAIDDLGRAGLGERGVEARVVNVAAEAGLPADPGFEKRSPSLAWLSRGWREAALSSAVAAAQRGAERLNALMPGWNVEPIGAAGTAHRVLMEAAETWPADLLVVGSRGRGVIGRLFHGSVAQMCVSNCRRSVRIGRGGRKGATEGGLRILVADDGSPTAEAAVNVVKARKWPAGSEAIVIFAVELPVVGGAPALGPEAGAFSGELIEARRELLDYGRALTESTVEALGAAGLSARPIVLEGLARQAINDLAEREAVDCVFLGARGHRVLERFMLGSVAAGVASGAPCSVEIIRPDGA
jgi:nucleotide-binding universal stress UspA family protein